MRCLWCGGYIQPVKELPHKQIKGFQCLMCARSDDYEWEANLREIRDKEEAGFIEYRAYQYYGIREPMSIWKI